MNSSRSPSLPSSNALPSAISRCASWTALITASSPSSAIHASMLGVALDEGSAFTGSGYQPGVFEIGLSLTPTTPRADPAGHRTPAASSGHERSTKYLFNGHARAARGTAKTHNPEEPTNRTEAVSAATYSIGRKHDPCRGVEDDGSQISTAARASVKVFGARTLRCSGSRSL